jgi:beta-lactamase regulating signal transducer with metallopeptidase domain
MISEVALESAAYWLMRTMLLGTVWFLVIAAVLQFTREPARRVRLLAWAMLGAVVISFSGWLPSTSSWALPSLTRLNGAPTPASVPDVSVTTSHASSIPDASSTTSLTSTDEEEDLLTDESADAITGFPALPTNSLTRAVGSTQKPPSAPSGVGRIALLSGLCLYAAGLFVITAWLLAGVFGLWRVVTTAQFADARLSELWNAIRPSDLKQTRLLTSSRTTQPSAFQFRRSYVVLPETWRDQPAERIEWALLHEAEHILRRDFPIWQVANLARIVFWCHPLLWWMRRELRVTQDFLADAAAARRTEARIDYAEFLTASARAGVGRSPLVGLGLLGRRSDLYRRVAMLLTRDKSLEDRTPRWWTWSVVGGVALVLACLATLQVGAGGTGQSVVLPPTAAASLTEAPVVSSSERDGFNPFSAAPQASSPSLAQAPPPGAPIGAASVAPIGAPPAAAEGVSNSAPKADDVVQKLKVIPGEMIEVEPGVHIGIRNVYNPNNAATWSPDGSVVEDSTGSGAPMEGGSGSASGNGGPPQYGGPPQMYGGMPAGFAGPGMAVQPPADSRLRGVTVFASRPNPAAIQVSVDGVQSQAAQTTYKPKFKEIQVPAYWPEEQMVASVAVRFASRTVARELTSSRDEGETFTHPSGQMMAALGRWTEGADLRTEASLTLDGPLGGRYVLEAEAIDVEGTAHRGKVQLHGADGGMMSAMMGGYGTGGGYGGMAMGPAGGYPGAAPGGASGVMVSANGSMAGMMAQAPTGTVVFPHLPPSRISKIRLTWHPYGWVIFRNVSLEPGEKSNLTAELFLDKSQPTPQPTGSSADALPEVSPPGRSEAIPGTTGPSGAIPSITPGPGAVPSNGTS